MKIEEKRKLATIQKIVAIEPIKGADFIECATILGWKCVVSKGQYTKGENIIYCEIDSFLPIREEFEVLRRNSYKKAGYLREGFRVKTLSFKKQISQGYVTDLTILPENRRELAIGTDVSDDLGIIQWEEKETLTDIGCIVGGLPDFIIKSREFRLQSNPDALKAMKGKPYYITNKVDGQSFTIFKHQGKIGISGHNTLLKSDTFKYISEVQHILDKLENYDNIAIRGELAGEGICKNRGGIEGVQFFAYALQDTHKHKFNTFEEFTSLCKENEIQMVEIIEDGDSFDYSMEELIKMADGVYESTGKKKEGIVVTAKSFESTINLPNNSKLSFKVISNQYLLAE